MIFVQMIKMLDEVFLFSISSIGRSIFCFAFFKLDYFPPFNMKSDEPCVAIFIKFSCKSFEDFLAFSMIPGRRKKERSPPPKFCEETISGGNRRKRRKNSPRQQKNS